MQFANYLLRWLRHYLIFKGKYDAQILWLYHLRSHSYVIVDTLCNAIYMSSRIRWRINSLYIASVAEMPSRRVTLMLLESFLIRKCEWWPCIDAARHPLSCAFIITPTPKYQMTPASQTIAAPPPVAQCKEVPSSLTHLAISLTCTSQSSDAYFACRRQLSKLSSAWPYAFIINRSRAPHFTDADWP